MTRQRQRTGRPRLCGKCRGQKSELTAEQIASLEAHPVTICSCVAEAPKAKPERHARFGTYRTYNIDEAAYYCCAGFRMEFDGIVERSGCFAFDDTPAFERARNEYYSGEPVISLHKWLTVRMGIKNAQKSKMSVDENMPYASLMRKRSYARRNQEMPEVDPNTHVDVFTPTNGEAYHFISNGSIHKQIFGMNPVHVERIRLNNCFRTFEDARVMMARQKLP